jgi:enoyl-CoA hydratase/carnithine racemase
VVPPEQLADETAALANQIAGKLGAAVRIGKEAFYAQLQMPVAEAYAYTGEVMVQNMLRDDTAEGIDAFLGKRDPKWDQ